MANYIGNQLKNGEFKKLDDITSSFDNSTTTFDLAFNGTSVVVGGAEQLVVSLNGVIQNPGVSYSLGTGGSQIVFSEAPSSTASCFITLFGGIGSLASQVADNTITSTKIADGAVTANKIPDDSITSGKIVSLNAGKLTGALPAIDGSALTGIDALPTQTGHGGEYLTTDGTTASWAELNPNKTTYGMFENANTITANYSITSGNNAMTAGPITIADGVDVTIPDGSTWTIV